MSVDIIEIEQRLSILEAQVGEVRKQLSGTSSPKNWVEQISGSMKEIPEDEYQQILEHCRRVRDSDTELNADPNQP